jgi:hypothetical protein
MAASVVIPNYNGGRFLDGCLGSLARQTVRPREVVIVDNGSQDGSLELLAERHPDVRVLALGRNTGFAAAANRGIAAVETPAVALLNPDVVLADDWLERMTAALDGAPSAASVACKMVDMGDTRRLYDTGDFLRRDGVAEQRGRYLADDGAFDAPGEVWGACAGAAVYRRAAVLDLGGFDERFFLYLEDVDLALRLRMAGWTCRYEPVVALHVGESSPVPFGRPVDAWVERNTLLLAAKAFPVRWAPYVLYRQLGWLVNAMRTGGLRAHVRGMRDAAPALPAMVRERARLRAAATVPVEDAVPHRPIRGR